MRTAGSRSTADGVDDKHEDQDYRIEARVTDAANREVAGHTTVLGDVWIVSRERGAGELCVPERAAGAREGDGAGLRRQAGADAGACGGALEKWDSVTHERIGDAGSQQRCDNGRGWNGAGGPADERGSWRL